MDLEIAHDHSIQEQRDVLKKLSHDLKGINLPITIFSTSEAVDKFTNEVLILKHSGNEISCHGYNHSAHENYSRLSQKEIEELIKDSTLNIENKIQEKVSSFRGPGFSTSASTQSALMNNGYKCDFSVCSQRIDFMNSAGGKINWLYSPRKPYHPAYGNPYKKGDLPLWVVPLSSIGIPFVSGMVYLFGLRFMKYYFNLLYQEAKRINKPIVYLFHSYEFTCYKGKTETHLTNTASIAKHKWFHKYYGTDSKLKYNNNLQLLEYILSFSETEPFTSSKYSEYLESN